MSKPVRTVSGWLLGLLVATALLLGGRAAFAKPVTAMCPDDGDFHLGTCASTQECQDKCDLRWGMGQTIGQCTGGCCKCLL